VNQRKRIQLDFERIFLKLSSYINGRQTVRSKGSLQRTLGISLRTSFPPQEQKTWVRIPPGMKVFRESKVLLLSTYIYIINLKCIVCVVRKEEICEGTGTKLF
jgi:hypothetical protein